MPLDYRRVLEEQKQAETDVREATEQLEVSRG